MMLSLLFASNYVLSRIISFRLPQGFAIQSIQLVKDEPLKEPLDFLLRFDQILIRDDSFSSEWIGWYDPSFKAYDHRRIKLGESRYFSKEDYDLKRPVGIRIESEERKDDQDNRLE